MNARLLSLDALSLGHQYLVPLRLGFRVGPVQKRDADEVAVHPGELASPVSEAGRREDEKEFFQPQPFDRALDNELGAAIRHIVDLARTLPCAVNAHDAGAVGAFEGYAGSGTLFLL